MVWILYKDYKPNKNPSFEQTTKKCMHRMWKGELLIKMNEEFLLKCIKFVKQRVREIYGRKVNYEIVNVRDYYEGTLGFTETNYVQFVVKIMDDDFELKEYLIERFNPDPRSYGWSREEYGEDALRELHAITSYIKHKKDWKAEKFVFGDIDMKPIKKWEKKVEIKQ